MNKKIKYPHAPPMVERASWLADDSQASSRMVYFINSAAVVSK